MPLNFPLDEFSVLNAFKESNVKLSKHINLPSVGNRIIDSEHQILDGLIFDIGQLIMVNHNVALSVAIRMLHENLHLYFAVEESIAQAAGFNFTNHRLIHQTMSNNCRAITDKFTNQIGKHSNIERLDFINSLSDLLVQHIKVGSKPFKKILDTYLYDFKPLHDFKPNHTQGLINLSET